jgi:hypothetical protein
VTQAIPVKKENVKTDEHIGDHTVVVSNEIANRVSAVLHCPRDSVRTVDAKIIRDERGVDHTCEESLPINWRWDSWEHTHDAKMYVSRKLPDGEIKILVPKLPVVKTKNELKPLVSSGKNTGKQGWLVYGTLY